MWQPPIYRKIRKTMAELPNRMLGHGRAMLALLSQRPDGLGDRGAPRSCVAKIYRQINETIYLGMRAEKDILCGDKIVFSRIIPIRTAKELLL